jgi:hypothetical protein
MNAKLKLSRIQASGGVHISGGSHHVRAKLRRAKNKLNKKVRKAKKALHKKLRKEKKKAKEKVKNRKVRT